MVTAEASQMMSDKRKVWFAIVLVLLASVPCLALARQTIEASTVVTGSIVVTSDGNVSSYTLDHPEKLSKGIVDVVASNVPKWKFQPPLVQGKPAAVKANMSIRLVARKLANGNYNVAVRGATFTAGPPGSWSDFKVKRVPPKYPRQAIEARVGGTVYLVASIDRQGTVENVAAQQVNLDVQGPKSQMDRWRKVLGDAAAAAVRQWKFDPSAATLPATKTDWIVGIPVKFYLSDDGNPPPANMYGRWQSYVPGPMNLVPWLDQRQLATGSADAIAAGAIRRLDGQDLQLKTSLGGS